MPWTSPESRRAAERVVMPPATEADFLVAAAELCCDIHDLSNEIDRVRRLPASDDIAGILQDIDQSLMVYARRLGDELRRSQSKFTQGGV